MLQSGDMYVVIMIVAILAIWLAYRFRRWLYTPPSVRLPLPYESPLPAEGKATDLLAESGYEWVAGKQRISICMNVDDEVLESRLFVDGVARRGHELFIVKCSRERQPMEWTGSALRERLLPYFLIFKEASGVVYVDLEAEEVRKIAIDLKM